MLIGISGYATSGKDTTAKAILSFTEQNKSLKELPWSIQKFAEPIKQAVAAILQVPRGWLESNDFKNSFLPDEWAYPIPEIPPEKVRVKMTVRIFLQRYANALRNHCHEDIWVNTLMAKYQETEGNFPNWVLSDLRYPNEAAAIKRHDGLIIRVNRLGVLPANEDYGEVALDSYPFDYVIENDGTEEQLSQKVRSILLDEGIFL